MRRKVSGLLKWTGIFSILLLIVLNYGPILEFLRLSLEEGILRWGFVGITVSIFVLEFIPQPFISSLIPLSSGIVFGLDIYRVLMFAIVSAVIANYLAYLLGLRYGERIVKFFMNQKTYGKSVEWFELYGKKSMTVLALTPLPYFPIMGGIFKMNNKEFIVYALVPRIIYLVVFSLGAWALI